MSAKNLFFSTYAREKIMEGVSILTDAVQVTLGPRGRNVAIEKSFGYPLVTKDGVSVAREVEVEDKLVNIGVQMLKEVASKTSDVAGDGTTTATVLARSIAQEGYKRVVAGMNPIDLKRGIDFAVSYVVNVLKEMSTPCTEYKSIAQVGTVSANSDLCIGKVIADAMEKVGKEGIITVEDGTSITDTLDVVDGMQFERGYVSPYFITNQRGMACELEEPLVLITDKKISNIRDLVPLLEELSKVGKALFIIAEDVESEALATLVVNSIRGIVKVCAVKAPGFGDRRRAILEDIAILTGTKVISEDTGLLVESVKLNELGRVKRIIVTKDNSTLIGGFGDASLIEERVLQLKEYLKDVTSEYDKEKIKERIAKLSGGVAVIKVGAATEMEMKEKKARIEDALHATRAAVEEGVVPGGGVAFVKASKKLAEKLLELQKEEYVQGVHIVLKALESPFRQIVENAGFESSIILDTVKKNSGNYGFDCSTGTYGDMFSFGIIDPTKVCRTALQNAASVSNLIIMTECVITDSVKKVSDYGDSGRAQIPYGSNF